MRTAPKIIASLSIVTVLTGNVNAAAKAETNGSPEITGLTVTDFSSGGSYGRVAGNVVSEQGAWLADKLPAQVTLDLGSYYDIKTLEVRNYFEAQVPGREAKEVEVWVASEPDGKYVQLDGDARSPGVQPFLLGKGRENIHKSFDLSDQTATEDVRRVRFVVLSSHGAKMSGLARVKFQGAKLPSVKARNQALAQRRKQAEQILAAARQKVLARNRAEYKKNTLKGRPGMAAFDQFNERRVAKLEEHARNNGVEAAIAKLWLHVDSETPEFWKDKPKEVLEQLAADHTAVQHPNGDIWGELARFCLDTDVEEASRIITESDLNKYVWHHHYNLVGLYNMFNADNGTRAKLLSADATDKLRAHVFDTFEANKRPGNRIWRVFHFLPDEPWWTWGNQNHGFVFQSYFYGVASILKDYPEYAEKFNAGNMISWGQGAKEETPPELAKIPLAEFAERARQFWRNRLAWMSRHGIWAEDMLYRTYDIEVLYHLLGSAPDPVIRKRAEMMLDIHWTMYALQMVHGQLGGAKNRYKLHYVGSHPERARAGYYFGELAGAENGSSINAATANYIPPAIAYDLLADPGKRGCFTYRERLQNLGPMPPLAAWKQSYVTPEYVLGAYIKHDKLDDWFRYSERAGQGITFGKARAILNLRPMATWQPYHGLQHGPVLLARWFGKGRPYISIMQTQSGGAEVEPPVAEGGWVFGKAGDAYYALRPAAGEFAIGKTGKDSRELQHFDFPEGKEKIPFIVHAGGATEDGSFEQFKKRILRNKISYQNGALTYDSKDWGAMRFAPDPSKPAEELRQVKGWFKWNPVELPEKLFVSPYLNSEYGSGIITAEFGDRKLILDFNKNERRVE